MVWLTNIQNVDPTIVTYRYKANEPTHGLFRPSNIPTGIVAFKKFFLGAQIWMGRALEIDDIYKNYKFWMKKNETAMHCKKLQQKHTVREYFLLWSTSEMCPKNCMMKRKMKLPKSQMKSMISYLYRQLLGEKMENTTKKKPKGQRQSICTCVIH